MPDLYVEPHILADAGRSLATERSVLSEVADALSPALGVVAAALPGSRTALVAGEIATTLTAAVRAAVADLDQLAAALTTAAREYRVVEQATVAGIERDGRVAV
jgi:hypothetical protein